MSSYREAGRFADAIALLEKLLADSERILGPEHPDTLQTRSALGLAYRDAGRVAEAIALLEKLVADSERILGPEHPDTLQPRSALGLAYRDAGRVAEAIALFEQVLADRERFSPRAPGHTGCTREPRDLLSRGRPGRGSERPAREAARRQ